MSFTDILALSLVEVVGDFGFKFFANEGGIKNFAMGTTGYIGVVYFLIRSLQGSQLMIVNAGWDGMNAIVSALAAYIFLGERLDKPIRYFGIVLIVIGLMFLDLPLTRSKAFRFPKFFT